MHNSDSNNNNNNNNNNLLYKEFENAVANAMTLNKLTNQDKLKLYGLYKVSTVGKFNTDKEKELGFFDYEKKAKYGSWKKFSNLTEKEAMFKYILLYNKLSNSDLNKDLEENLKSLSLNDNINKNKNLVDENLDIDGIGDLEELSNIQPFQFSSTAKKTKEEITDYLKNASNEECVFYEIKNKFYECNNIDVMLFSNYSHINYSTGQTLLHSAVDSKNISAIKALDKLNLAKDNINNKDDYGMTPMHIAGIMYDSQCYEYLMKYNPDLKILDNDSNSPYNYLEENEDISKDELNKLRNYYFKY